MHICFVYIVPVYPNVCECTYVYIHTCTHISTRVDGKDPRCSNWSMYACFHACSDLWSFTLCLNRAN